MQAAEKAIQAVIDLNTRIGIPPTLADAGVRQDQLENLAKKAFDDPSHASNPRTCTQADLLMLYQQAFNGQ
jgi:alcohol dehydrogenase class IV